MPTLPTPSTTSGSGASYTDEQYEQFGVLADQEGLVYERASGRVQRNGVWEFDQPFICRFSTFSEGKVVPTYGQAHFLLPWALAQESRWEQLKGDWCRITTHYAGAATTGTLVESSSSQQRTEPIVVSPNFPGIVNYIQKVLGNPTTGGVVYDVNANGDKVFKAFGINSGRYQGVESYDEGGVSHSVSYASGSHSDRWSKLFLIDTPKGSPPPIPEGSNWRLSDISESLKGYVYDIKETWESSGPNGWDPIIYGPKGTGGTPSDSSSGSSSSSGSGSSSSSSGGFGGPDNSGSQDYGFGGGDLLSGTNSDGSDGNSIDSLDTGTL